MGADALSAVVALLLAVSLASERLVTVLKTLVPSLGLERIDAAGQPDPVRDRWRRFGVQLIAVVAAWITTGFLHDGGYSMLGKITLGVKGQGIEVPVFVVGLLASGGSALWNNVLGYTKAAKDAQNAVRANDNLSFVSDARAQGLPIAARPKDSTRATKVLEKLSTLAEPVFSNPKPRI